MVGGPRRHRLLFLYLYDLYVDLYGKEFADREVAFGKTLEGLHDYEGAWNWAMAMSREERLSRFAEVLKPIGNSYACLLQRDYRYFREHAQTAL